MAILFILLFIPCLLAVIGKYSSSKITFWLFLLVLLGVFIHHITDALNIQL